MKIKTLPLGMLQTNCYLVFDDAGTAVVIDPAEEAERILAAAQQNGAAIAAILLTHGHFDHVGAVRAVAEAAHCPVWMHEKELTLPTSITAGELYYTDTYDEGDIVRVGKLSFSVLHTPGHTPGSVCLRCENALFSGDTLFEGSCGRVDFPGGSGREMRLSLRRLSELPETLDVYPGHGGATTIGQEKKLNPYMRG